MKRPFRPFARLLVLASLLLSAPAFALMSEEKEAELGAELHLRMMASVNAYPDPQLQEYVDEIGQRVAKHSDSPDRTYTFTVLDDDLVNAFAIPGGYIYITRGMLAHLNSEAELAAVLGHEIGHVTARHSLKRQSKQGLWNALSTLSAIATRSRLAGEAAGIVGDVMTTGYGRDQELEADQLGAQYMAKAGYATEAITDTVTLLKSRESFELERARAEDRTPRIPHGTNRTHPDNDQRFREAVAAARKFRAAEVQPENQQRFLDMIDGLAYGPSKTAGTVRRNYFYNAKYGIKMKFPENWRVGGAASQIQAMSDTNDAALQIDVVVPGRTMTAEDVIRKKYRVDKLVDGKSITVAGMRAHIATIKRYSNGPFGNRPARVAAILDNRIRRAYVFIGTGKRDLSKIASDSDFIATIFSFDRMDAEDISLAEAPKVKIVRAEAGTTYAELADLSAIPTYAEQNLRLLNGAYPRGEPQAGELIKLVD
ncbi:MAG: M48 family metalloprotease [Pseudomonadota bacterium]